MSCLTSRPILNDFAGVSVWTFRCRAERSGFGEGESSGDYSLVFVRRGAFTIRVDGEELPADPNHFILFNANQEYQVAHPISGGDDCTSFSFSEGLIQDVLAELAPGTLDKRGINLPFISGLACGRNYLAHRRLLQSAANRAVDRTEVFELATGLLVSALRAEAGATASNVTPRQREVARAAHATLGQRFRENISLDEVARSVGYSEFHLARTFQKVFQRPIHQYVLDLRLRASLEELHRSDQEVGQIGVDLGFSSPSHFAYAFRRTFGMTPTQYRKSA